VSERYRGRDSGVYVHIPFCSAICPYCDFSVVVGDAAERSRYVDHLVEEIDSWSKASRSFGSFDTIYLGGGTPSALAPDDLARLLAKIQAAFPVEDDTWVSIEANPEDVDRTSLGVWRDLGIRTVSLGVQSFDDAELRFLGRRHDAAEARRSVEAALAAGFPIVSIDLIFGLPDQELSAWTRNLDAAGRLAPQHLSCYQLTIKESTPFARRERSGRLEQLPQSEQAGLFEVTHERLASCGLHAYEVSSFACREEHRSRHNQKYWRHLPYLGLGVAAHSFLERRRWWNPHDLSAYEARVAKGERDGEDVETLGDAELALEMVMLRLRTTDGLDLVQFRERFGIDIPVLNRRLLDALIEDGSAVLEHGILRPTPRGLAIADGGARGIRLDVDE